MKGNTVKGVSFERTVTFVVKPKSPMKPVYREKVPQRFAEMKKKILDDAGDMYFIEEEKHEVRNHRAR